MSNYAILAWQPLLRPPLPNVEPPEVPMSTLKALACRNSIISLAVLVTADAPVASARLVFTELASDSNRITADNFRIRLVGAVPTPEAGLICDPLYEVNDFAIERSAALYINVMIPSRTSAGTYSGKVKLLVNGEEAAVNDVKIEVANVVLPDVHKWNFFLNVWMNPGAVARFHDVPVWSEEHFELLKPYIEDLASHGQKTVVAPISYQPWGTQTRDPYPNLISCIKNGEHYEFDFSIFDRYVKLHEEYGIDRAIHCYSIVQGPGGTDRSVIEYTDAQTGENVLLETTVGDAEYNKAWGEFFEAFREHLIEKNWLNKVYIAFDEKPEDVMERLVTFMDDYAPDFNTSLAAFTRDDIFDIIDDLSLAIPFNESGVAEMSPTLRSTTDIAELLDPLNVCSIVKSCPEKMLTTFYVCCGPAYPNTFVHSPLVESRMLPFLAAQGGFDGFLRWSYNDWPDNPYEHPEWGDWPTGDVFFVYPGTNGPVSSLRWEQLREGIQDYELAMLASANIQDPEEMIDYEQAITLACRNVDGKTKSTGDIEIARRLLIPIAEHQNE